MSPAMKDCFDFAERQKYGCILNRKRQDGDYVASGRLFQQSDTLVSQPVNKDFLGSLWAEHRTRKVPG